MSEDFQEKRVDRETARDRLAKLREMLASGTLAPPPDHSTPYQVVITEEVAPYQPYNGTIDDLIASFEEAAQQDEHGQYWSARRLMPLLGYAERWDYFEKVITKAQVACNQSGQTINDHFTVVSKMVEIGSGAERAIKDLLVTRYGAYLIAQNGDSKKKQVAFAQSYFAVQTRRQEVADDIATVPPSEEQRRIMLREEMATHNKKLVSAAKRSGVHQPLDFAVFQNHGYEGLYGGLNRRGIQAAKGLPVKADILDHMGSTELAANLFRATQTEDKLRREHIQGKANANAAHFQVGRQVRKAIQEIGGTMPERLEAAEDIGKVRRRLAKSNPPREIE